jgi:hypothetical protein
MSRLMLLVPDASAVDPSTLISGRFSFIDVQSWTLGAGENMRRPKCDERSDSGHAEAGIDAIAWTCESHSEQLTRLLTHAPADPALPCILMPGLAMPDDLRHRLPGALQSLLCRPAQGDLVYCSTSDDPCLLRVSGSSVRDFLRAGAEFCLQQNATIVPVPGAVVVERLPESGPGRPLLPASVLRAAIGRVVPSLRRNALDAKCLEAGLWLLWDHLDESHTVSQSLEGKGSPRTADYWHGIMHRREPDPGNAAWWARRFAGHPALDVLGASLQKWLQELAVEPDIRECSRRLLSRSTFNSMAMIELSTAARQHVGSIDDRTCRIVQYLEILNLLAWSCA